MKLLSNIRSRSVLLPAAILLFIGAAWSYRLVSRPHPLPSVEPLRQATLLRQLRPKPDRLDRVESPLLAHYVSGRYEAVISAAGDEAALSPLDEILIGNSLALLGRWEEARSHYEKVPSGPLRADAYANSALAESALKNWREGISAGVEALALDQERGDLGAQAFDLATLGTLAFRLGDFEKAIGAHRRALELAVRAKDVWQEATGRASLGTIYYFQRDLHSALDEHKKALDLYRAASDPLGAVHTLNTLGVIHKELGEGELALDLFDRSRREYNRIGDREGEATAWVNLALIHQENGEIDRAIRSGRNALSLEREGGHPLRVAVTLGTLGMIQKSAGNFPEAIRNLEEALALFREAGASQEVHNVELQIKEIRDRLPDPEAHKPS